MAITTKVDNNIEALRGYCAVIVILYHCVYYSSKLNNGYDFTAAVIYYMPPGLEMVMVFFMLSGYVIGLTTNTGQSFNIGDYLKRRLVRLYPIYLVAILVTIILFKETLPSIMGTLFFAQNLFVNVLDHNPALWSLNYEFLFYILAIPIIKFNINPKYILVFLFSILIALVKIDFASLALAYIIGFIFWMTGYALSKFKLKEASAIEAPSGKLISLFFLLLSADVLNVISFIWIGFVKKLNITFGGQGSVLTGGVNIRNLGIYFLCLYAICVAASIKSNWVKALTLVVFLSSWGALLYVVINGSFFKTDIFYVPAPCLILSTLFYFSKRTFIYSVSFWAKLGGISYALYVMHTPIMYGIGQIPFFSSGLVPYIIRVVLVVVITLIAAYLLEMKLQPRIKQYFFIKSVH